MPNFILKKNLFDLGVGVFAMAVANCLLGISEKSYGRL